MLENGQSHRKGLMIIGQWKLLVELNCDVEESNWQFCRASIELIDALVCASRWLMSNF
jgi:hypothetical protein